MNTLYNPATSTTKAEIHSTAYTLQAEQKLIYTTANQLTNSITPDSDFPSQADGRSLLTALLPTVINK